MKIRKPLNTNISITSACMFFAIVGLGIGGFYIIMEDTKEESFSLTVTPQGPSTQSWIGDDERTYTIIWEDPIYKETSK